MSALEAAAAKEFKYGSDTTESEATIESTETIEAEG